MTAFVKRSASPPVLRSNTFDDLLPDGVAVAAMLPDRVEFTADLDEATATAIADRMVSADPAVLAARATLRADRDALDAEDPLRRLYDYVLGDPILDPVLPQT